MNPSSSITCLVDDALHDLWSFLNEEPWMPAEHDKFLGICARAQKRVVNLMRKWFGDSALRR